MIPVALQLKNFMSYGTVAPVLDFEQFKVACLSGRNGQGKSALLEAITWSLWGEARKSSGGHKPDDELIRVGERDMQVEFVFDIEGERYRVVRSYTRSATGKTSKAELELHLLESANGDYRPLTGASIKETQEQINHVVGVDYNTFINSAFLLQGRSDEFTKKRPTERKEILARILNLDRYDRLHEMAAAREREARKKIEQAALDIERLTRTLEPESEWKAQHAEVEQAIRDERTHLDALRAEEKHLAERLAGLDAKAREADNQREALDAVRARLAEREQDAANLRQRIADAEALIAQRDAIQRDHERYLALQKERDELDEKNEIFRGIEKQLERVERELKDCTNEQERQLDRLSFELKGNRRSLAECEAQLAEMPSVRRRLGAARAAQKQFEEMDAVSRKRKELEQELRLVERELLRKKEELGGKLGALEQQIARDTQALLPLERLSAEANKLERDVANQERLRKQLGDIEEDGKTVAQELNRLSGTHTAKKGEREELHEQYTRLDAGGEGICPTCGTELTSEHRREVKERFERRIAVLDRTLQELLDQMDQKKAQRDELRQTYLLVKDQVDALKEAPERLARVREQMRAAQESKDVLADIQKEADALRRTLEAEAFGDVERRRLQALKLKRDALAFDEDVYERIRTDAAQVARFEDRLRQLEETAGRKEQLEASIERTSRDAEAIRKQLDDGTLFKPIRDQIRQLNQQLKDVGFDPRRFRAVKQDLEDLKDAGRRVTDLVNAQQNHARWKEQLAENLERADKVRRDIEVQTARLAEVEAALKGRASLDAQHQDKIQASRAVEARLHDVQVQLGQLSEKLEKAKRDRGLLKERRKDHKTAESASALYKHLKAAFGKHGIPSLIIEQTLPEIEYRTNDLLERLTDGKMHVRLETLKDKKTGGTKETLELKITDEQGVSRPYETFSGGEAFRVNFALRIALAQLLAERSGVRVRTLVVDEGFGTQDQQGIQNLVEAIQTIQDDFDKILVITHLPELKEAFPVRIEVAKDPVDGSRFEVIGT